MAAIAGVGLAAVVAATHEPDDPAAIAAVLFAIAIVSFAGAAALFYWFARIRGRRRRGAAIVALRRGAIVGLGVMALGSLRVIDALSAITAIFLLAALAALEGFLSARA